MKIGVVGCNGRMGIECVKAILNDERVTLSGGLVRTGSSYVGQDIGTISGLPPLDIVTTDSLHSLCDNSDALINFSTPKLTLETARCVAQSNKILIDGTTGLNEDDVALFSSYAKDAAIVWSSNMSVGVNILFKLVEQLAGQLHDNYDIEILEMHHRHKVDAPSGTALSLGESAAKGRKIALDKVACKSRDGNIGARPKGEIGFATLRGGSVIGDHTVIFAGDNDRIELTHKSSNRGIYAEGAVQAALWARNKAPGLYSMKDVLAKPA